MFDLILNKYPTLRKLSCKQKQLNGKPWLLKGFLMSIKTKHKLLKNMTKTKMGKYKNQYQTHRNKLTYIIKLAKINTLVIK